MQVLKVNSVCGWLHTLAFAILTMLFAGVALAQDEAITDGHAFNVPVSSLKTETKPLYYRGRPLTTDNPSAKYQHGQEVMEAARKFPDALSCLTFEPDDETVSLASLNTEKFEKIAELEICLQRALNELGDISRIEPWLRAVGFEWVEERPNLWLGPVGPVSFIALWRREDVFSGRPYPMSGNYNQTEGRAAKNLALTLAIRRRDVRVIGVDAVMNICDQKGENECQYNLQ